MDHRRTMNGLLLGLAGLLLVVSGARGDTKLEDGDIFNLSVTGAPREFIKEYDLECTVAQGVILIPNVGLVRAAGLTASELAGAIEKEPRVRKIFTKPAVIINVVCSDPMITIGGAAPNMGRYMLSDNKTLVRAIATALGPEQPWGDVQVRLIRKGQATQYSWKALRKDPAKDPKLLPGDYIEVEGEF
jgi:protein involved in polysaccharide export with SLBB domain